MGSGTPETTLVSRASLRLSSLGGNQPNFLFSLAFAGRRTCTRKNTCLWCIRRNVSCKPMLWAQFNPKEARKQIYLYKSIDPQGRAQQFARVCEIIYPSTSSFANCYCRECILNPLAFSVRQKTLSFLTVQGWTSPTVLWDANAKKSIITFESTKHSRCQAIKFSHPALSGISCYFESWLFLLCETPSELWSSDVSYWCAIPQTTFIDMLRQFLTNRSVKLHLAWQI